MWDPLEVQSLNNNLIMRIIYSDSNNAKKTKVYCSEMVFLNCPDTEIPKFLRPKIATVFNTLKISIQV
jgi:hypothetical protein